MLSFEDAGTRLLESFQLIRVLALAERAAAFRLEPD